MPIFNKKKKTQSDTSPSNTWARPEMQVVFRAELMPGKSREERTFRVRNVRRNGRVELHDFEGEHREAAFEPLNFLREKQK